MSILKNNKIDIYFRDSQSFAVAAYKDQSLDVAILQGEEFRLRILSKEDKSFFEAYVDFREDVPLSKKFVSAILEKGAVCFLIFSKNKIIASGCFISGEIPLFGFDLDFLFCEDQGYLFHFYVDGRFRRRGIMKLLVSRIVNYACCNGFRYLFGAVYPWNTPSFFGLRSLGFEKYGSVAFLKAGFFRFHRFFKNSCNKKKLLLLKARKRAVLF